MAVPPRLRMDVESNRISRPRFTSGTTERVLALGPDEKLPSGSILVPEPYTRDVISEADRVDNMLIIGRSQPSARGRIQHLPTRPDCFYVHDTSVTGKKYVWVLASLQDC